MPTDPQLNTSENREQACNFPVDYESHMDVEMLIRDEDHQRTRNGHRPMASRDAACVTLSCAIKISMCCLLVILQELFENQDKSAKEFRELIRQYNNELALASMVADIKTPKGHGPYCFKVHGQVCHCMGDLRPPPGQQHKFAQGVHQRKMAGELVELEGRAPLLEMFQCNDCGKVMGC
ncbi:unnamed protein product, partial [Mesorhabditis belari]|uniref:Uncharacterized protein n=1 Tax=Mesorhabditis belari TaxID=2138241 RepID=A0AAF3F978_9BILA